jgi:hypothetical protein
MEGGLQLALDRVEDILAELLRDPS